MQAARSTRIAWERAELGALRRAIWSRDREAATAAWQELGRMAARHGWARRLLFDAAQGKLAIPAAAAVPGLRELARAEPEHVLALLQRGTATGALVAGQALGQEDEAFEAELAAAARGSEASARLAGVAGLGEAATRGSVRAVEELAARLGDPDGQVRWAAACALGRARGEASTARAVLWLDQAIQSGEERSLSGAAFGAATLSPARPREAGRLLLSAAVAGAAGRRAAARAMAMLPARAAAGVADLCVRDADADVRALSTAAVGRWAGEGSARARRQLARLARDEDPAVRAAAAEIAVRESCLGGPRLVQRLADDSSHLVRAAVAAGLGRRASSERDGWLRHLVRDDAASVRAAAIRSLGSMGVPSGARDACRDPEPMVRAAAAAALGAGTGADVRLLLMLSQDREGEVLQAAARALGHSASGPAGPLWDRLVELASVGVAGPAAWEGMAAALDKDPGAAAEVLWGWPVGAAPLEGLREIARAAQCPEVAEVARTLSWALEGGEELGEALQDAAAAFADVQSQEAEVTCSWLAVCADVRSLTDVADVSSAPPRARTDAVALLGAAARAIASGLRTRSEGAQKLHFSRARAGIEDVLRRESSRLAWNFAHAIAQRWQQLLAKMGEGEGQADLRARLSSASVLAGGRPTALVEVTNVGPGSASRVELGAPGGGEAVAAARLVPGERLDFELPLPAAGAGPLKVRWSVRFLDATGQRGATFEDTVEAVQPGALKTTTNPYVVGKPLVAGSAMFFGRSAEMTFVERALASGESGTVVVLVGQRRTGKTSLLRQLEARLAGRFRPAFIDVQGMMVKDTEAFYEELARRAMDGDGAVPMLSDGDAPLSRRSTGADLVREAATRADRRMVLLLDEFDDLEEKVRSGRLSQDVFSQLRNLIQHSGDVSLVLSGTHRLENLAAGYWSFLLNLATYRRIGCLDEEAAIAVLRVPLGRLGIVCEDAALRRVMRLAGRHPYFLQLLGYRLVERCVQSGEAAVRMSTVEMAANDVVEQGEIHLRYLWDLAGPEGRSVLRMVAGVREGLTQADLRAGTQLDPARLGATLGELAAAEVISERAGRHRLEVGLLAPWLSRAQPERHEVA